MGKTSPPNGFPWDRRTPVRLFTRPGGGGLLYELGCEPGKGRGHFPGNVYSLKGRHVAPLTVPEVSRSGLRRSQGVGKRKKTPGFPGVFLSDAVKAGKDYGVWESKTTEA